MECDVRTFRRRCRFMQANNAMSHILCIRVFFFRVKLRVLYAYSQNKACNWETSVLYVLCTINTIDYDHFVLSAGYRMGLGRLLAFEKTKYVFSIHRFTHFPEWGDLSPICTERIACVECLFSHYTHWHALSRFSVNVINKHFSAAER